MPLVDLKFCLGFDFAATFPLAGKPQVPLDPFNIGNVASYAGSCHILEMDSHYTDYCLSPGTWPQFPPIPGFPPAHPFPWLDAKVKGKEVVGNIGESAAAIMADRAFALTQQDIAHIKVKHKTKTPDYIMRFSTSITTQMATELSKRGVVGTLQPPEWWPVEAKGADGRSPLWRQISRAFRQLASYWNEVRAAAGFGVVVGYQYRKTKRTSPFILVSLFLPKDVFAVKARLDAMTSDELAKAEVDDALKGALYGC